MLQEALNEALIPLIEYKKYPFQVGAEITVFNDSPYPCAILRVIVDGKLEITLRFGWTDTSYRTFEEELENGERKQSEWKEERAWKDIISKLERAWKDITLDLDPLVEVYNSQTKLVEYMLHPNSVVRNFAKSLKKSRDEDKN